MFNRIISKIKEFFGIYEIDYNQYDYNDDIYEMEDELNEYDNSYFMKEKKKYIKRNRYNKKCQFEMIELMARKERIIEKIKSFVPSKDKDHEKLNKWYVDIRNIDAELKFLEMESETNLDDVFNDSKFERYKIRQQRKFKKIKKKFKKFYKENRHTICNIALLVSLCIVKFGIRKLLPL